MSVAIIEESGKKVTSQKVATDVRLQRNRKYKPILYISNWFITGKHEFTLFELKFFLAVAYLIQKHSCSDNKIRILAADLATLLGFNKNSYRQIKDACAVMMASILEIIEPEDVANKVEEPRWKMLTIFDKAEYAGGYVDIEYKEQTKTFFTNLTKDYTSLHFPSIVCQQAYYSLKAYLLFRARLGQQSFTSVTYTIDEIKMRLCLKGNTYELFGHLKSKILTPAQRDLKNTTEIKFEMEFIRSGKQICAVKFNISRNSGQQPLLPEFWKEYGNAIAKKDDGAVDKHLLGHEEFKSFFIEKSKFKKGSMLSATIGGLSAHVTSNGEFLTKNNKPLTTKEQNEFLTRLYREYLRNPSEFYGK
ncbi:MAG: replication initiation protein [Campylobacterales bacterium]|nr:replication initiation protein [Campylobacterales bacterium]